MAKAKPVKQKKENKFLKQLVFFFKTLFSNDACVDGRTRKWYYAIIVGVLAAVIATIPTMVGRFTVNASSFFSNSSNTYSYDLENSLKAFNKETKDVKMEIKDGVLTLDETAWKNVCKNPKDTSTDFWGYYYKVPVTITQEKETSDSSSASAALITSKDEYYCGLAVYYSGSENPYTYAVNKASNIINDPNNILGHTVKTYSVNMLVLGKESVFLAKAVNGTSFSSANSVQVKYDHSSFNGKDLHTIVTPAENQTVIQAWSSFLNNGYSSTRVLLAWQYSGIMFSICVGMEFLMGLLIFIMTRGKNNPFRIYTFWDSQKIGYFASFSPALLGLLSFIPMFSGMTMFLFPMLYILRVTWMSMRSLRPQA